MSVRILMFAASLGVAALFSGGPAMAGSVSGCTMNGDGVTQTCNFYETDANGNSSEISSPVSNLFPGTYWHTGYSAIDDPNGTLSDVIVWNVTAQTGTLYSCDDGALASNCTNAIAELGSLGVGFEDANGDLLNAGKSRYNCPVSTDCARVTDTLNVYSGVDVPEPITLSIFGAGLAGAFGMRRRKAKM